MINTLDDEEKYCICIFSKEEHEVFTPVMQAAYRSMSVKFDLASFRVTKKRFKKSRIISETNVLQVHNHTPKVS